MEIKNDNDLIKIPERILFFQRTKKELIDNLWLEKYTWNEIKILNWPNWLTSGWWVDIDFWLNIGVKNMFAYPDRKSFVSFKKDNKGLFIIDEVRNFNFRPDDLDAKLKFVSNFPKIKEEGRYAFIRLATDWTTYDHPQVGDIEYDFFVRIKLDEYLVLESDNLPFMSDYLYKFSRNNIEWFLKERIIS